MKDEFLIYRYEYFIECDDRQWPLQEFMCILKIVFYIINGSFDKRIIN